MSTTVRRVFSGLTRVAFPQGLLTNDAIATVRLNSVRTLALGSPRLAKKTKEEKEVNSGPIKFSTSKASHRTWRVDCSMGSHHQRPWWKVLPVCLLTATFVLWCALRGDSNIDTTLKRGLNTHIPGLIPEKDGSKSS